MKNLINKEEKDQINSICMYYGIEEYTINSNGSVDVIGNIDFYNLTLSKIPLQFGNVSGNFDCYGNDLTSLEGSPVNIGGNFDCSHNNLTNLIGAPTAVGGDFNGSYSQLISLEGAPTTVGGNFYCNSNDLISTYCGDNDIELGGDFHYNDNYLPRLLQDNIVHIKLILKYQRHFEIWNDDLTLNEENFQMLLDEIKDGLL